MAVILTLPDGASPVDPGPGFSDIYTAMVIGHRAQDRDLSDEQALERCKPDVRMAITYVLGRIEATGASLDEGTQAPADHSPTQGDAGGNAGPSLQPIPPGTPRY